MTKQIVVRKWGRRVPALAWAMGLDALDIIPNTVDAVLTILGLSVGGIGATFGLATNTIFDMIQGLLSIVIFEDQRMWIGAFAGDVFLPSPLDLFPTYTTSALAIQLGLWK